MEKYNLYLTDYNTIISGNEEFNEIFLNEFLTILENNIKSPDYDITFENDCFEIKFKGIKYILALKEEDIIDYKIGKYNNFTIVLRQLITQKDEIKNKIKEQKREKKRKKELLKSAKSGKIFDLETRDIYIDYLKNKLKPPRKKYLKQLKNDFFESFKNTAWLFAELPFFKLFFYVPDEEDLEDEELDDNEKKIGISFHGVNFFVWQFGLLLLMVTLLPVIFKIAPNISLGLYMLIIAGIPFGVSTAVIALPFLMTTIVQFLTKRLVENSKKKKMLKEKIKTLSKMTFLENNKENELEQTKSLEEKEFLNQVESNSIVLKQIAELSVKIDYLNKEDKVRLIKNLKDILDEYNERIAKIDEIDGLSIENYKYIEREILAKLYVLDCECSQIREKDIQTNKDMESTKVIENRLDNMMGSSSGEVQYLKRK